MMKTMRGFILSLVLLSTSLAPASFEENAHRYLSGQEILWSLSLFFDFHQNTTNKEMCTQLQVLNLTLLGANSATTGEPISPTPTQGTVLWITGCIENYFASPTFSTNDLVRTKNLLGKNFPVAMLRWPWAHLSIDVQKELIRHMVSAFLGSDDVIIDFGFIQNPEDFRELLFQAAKARTNAPVLEIVTLLALNLSVRDEFLSY